MSRIFISYRRADSEGYVGRLYDHLVQYFSKDDLFMDVDNIRPGEDFVQVLEESVAACDVLLAIIGPNWLDMVDEHGDRRLDNWQDFVRLEVVTALKTGKLVIPILVQGAKMPRPTDLPDELIPLTRRHAVALEHKSFGYDVKQLVEAIRELTRPVQIIPTAESDAKAQQLKTVRDAIVNATESPLYSLRTESKYFPVLGEGNPAARIIFIGEAPGKFEVEQGRPFIGPSGELLNELLAGIGLRRDHVYVTNILKDRPPEQRDPSPLELAFYTPFLLQEIEIIQPRVIATLGSFAMEAILKQFDLPEKRQKIGQLHGKLIKATAGYGEVHIVPLYHPAVALYTASKKDVLRQDFEKLKLFV